MCNNNTHNIIEYKLNIWYIYVCVWQGCTGMLDELVGSHTKVVIYPT